MTPTPCLPPAHPDRILDCEMAAEDEFRALAERIEAAGWTGEEVAAALVSLAKNHVRFREETENDEANVRHCAFEARRQD